MTTRRNILLSSIGVLGVAGLARAQQAAPPAAGAAVAPRPAPVVSSDEAAATAKAGAQSGVAQGFTGSPDLVAGIPVNYDEAKAGGYTLPDPLKMNDGTPVTTAAQWAKRRPEILAMFETNQYGKAPPKPQYLNFDVFDKGTPAFNGTAKRKQIHITFTKDKSGPVLNLTVYTPANATKPVPMFFGLGGSVAADPGVAAPLHWDAATNTQAPAAPRGAFGAGRAGAPAGAAGAGRAGAPAAAARGPVGPSVPEQMLAAGFGYSAFNYTDIEPDALASEQLGIRSLYFKPGKHYPDPDEWGSIAAWSWGISRVIDYFETDKDVDAKRIAIHGVSRLGKTVAWTGARDTRVAATIASCSGEGGLALSRRTYGETISHLCAPSRFPYQFASNYARYGYQTESAPMDANMLVALHAPRPLLQQTASTDGWSDPHGEFLAAVDGGRVYELLGKKALGTTVWPKPTVPLMGDLSYYMHTGPHGTVPSDYGIYIEFLKAHLHPEA